MNQRNVLDHFATKHAPFLHGGGRKATDQLISCLALKGTEKVLEIGFGTGATQVRLKSLYPNLDLSGIERSANMLKKATSRLKWTLLSPNQLHLINEPFDFFPFPTNNFDVVFFESVFGILTIEEIKKNLKEIKRVLKPGGTLAFNESIWLSNIPIDTIHAINLQCKSDFGITLAQEEVITIEDWKAFLSSDGFEVQTIQNVRPGFSTNRFSKYDLLSMLFTYLGKLNAGFDIEMKSMDRLIHTTMNNSKADGMQYIDACLMLLKLK